MFSSGNLMNARLLQQLAQRMPQGAPGAQQPGGMASPQLPGQIPGAANPAFMRGLPGLMNALRQRQGAAAPISSPGAPDMGMGGAPRIPEWARSFMPPAQMGGASSAPATLPGFGAQPPMTQTDAMARMGAPQGMMPTGQMQQPFFSAGQTMGGNPPPLPDLSQIQQLLNSAPQMGGQQAVAMPAQMGGTSSAPPTLPGFGAQPPMTQTGAMAQMGAPQGMMPAAQMTSATPQQLAQFQSQLNTAPQAAGQQVMPGAPPPIPRFARGGFAVKRAC